jgi:hypothetical protein
MEIVSQTRRRPALIGKQPKAQPAKRHELPKDKVTLNGNAGGEIRTDLARLATLRKAQAKTDTKSPKKSDARSLMFSPESKAWKDLKKAEAEQSQVRNGDHAGLSGDISEADREKAKFQRSLDLGYQQRLTDITQKREKLEQKQQKLNDDLARFFPESRKEIATHTNAATKEMVALRESGGKEAFSQLGKVQQLEKRLSDKNLSPVQRARLLAEKSQGLKKLKDLGLSYPGPDKLKQYESDGLPQGDSSQAALDRAVFHKNKALNLDSELPRTPAQRDAYKKKIESEIASERSGLDVQEDRVRETYDRESRNYRVRAGLKKEDARKGLEAGLDRRTGEKARTFKINDLSEAVRNSPAMKDVPADAEARLENGRLTFKTRLGHEVSVKAGDESVTVTSDQRYRHAWGEILPGEVHTSAVTADGTATHKTQDYKKTGGKLQVARTTERVLDKTGNGKETVNEGDKLHSESTFEGGTRVSQDGPDGYTFKRKSHEDGSVTTDEEWANGAFSHRTTGKDGRVLQHDVLEKYDGKTTHTRLVDPSTGEVEIATRHERDRWAEGYDHTDITSTNERARFDDDGKLVDRTEQSKTVERADHERKARPSDFKSLPGNENIVQETVFDTPRELVAKLEERGEVKVQETRRETSDGQGNQNVEHLRTFSAGDMELTETRGENQATVYQLRKKVGEGKWNSETFFQGSPESVIRTNHTEESVTKGGGKFEVETTRTQLGDHPGAKDSLVPVDGVVESKKTKEGTQKDVLALAQKMGLDPKNLSSSEAYKKFQNLLEKNDGKLTIELQQSRETFEDKDKNTTTAVMVVQTPDGSRMALSFDELEGQGGVQAEIKGENGRAAEKSTTVFAEGERFEEVTGQDGVMATDRQVENLPTTAADIVDAGNEIRDNLGKARRFYRAGRGVGLKAARAARQMEAQAGRRSARLSAKLGVVTTGLTATSAIYELTQGNYRAAARSGAQTLEEVGHVASNLQAARGLQGSGKLLMLKGLGVAGALAGGLSSVDRFRDGDVVGGTVDIISAVASGVGMFVPGVGLVAVGATVFNLARDLYGDAKKRVDLADSYL